MHQAILARTQRKYPADGLCAGFGRSGVPTGACSPARQDAATHRSPHGHITQLGEEQKKVLHPTRSEEHTSELQSLMRISYAVFCLKKKIIIHTISITDMPQSVIIHINT